MNYIGVSDLKKSKALWAQLENERELVLTRDGKPGALILPLTPETVESTLRAVRRALFSETVTQIRKRQGSKPVPEKAIANEIREARGARRESGS
jgi:antitoxin (DNA-binding transcriptional repressor) of toxin-antitoxin stability system